jgi:Isoprenylcysteine carboxyl methyltransferase (ICMT) family
LLLALWARVTIGRNWSASVTLKKGHELIRTGPYALVRHPIYSGFLLMIIGTMIFIGRLVGIIVVAATIAGFWMGESQGQTKRRLISVRVAVNDSSPCCPIIVKETERRVSATIVLPAAAQAEACPTKLQHNCRWRFRCVSEFNRFTRW